MTDKKHSVRRKKELYSILLIVVVGGIMLLSVVGPNGYLELRKARQRREQQRALVEELRRSNAEQLKTIKAMRSDPDAIEGYAREKGYGRENEIMEPLPGETEEKH
jgi:cell division protein FtsB